VRRGGADARREEPARVPGRADGDAPEGDGHGRVGGSHSTRAVPKANGMSMVAPNAMCVKAAIARSVSPTGRRPPHAAGA